jgi:hypothetical protein
MANLKNEDYTSSKCESRIIMIIILPTSCESPKKNPITLKGKNNESLVQHKLASTKGTQGQRLS